jgi:alanine racemase
LRAAVGTGTSAALQIDSGMGRLGLMLREMAHYLADRERYAGIDLRFIMSHLACADEPAKAASAYQREMFERLTADFPGAPRSLANHRASSWAQTITTISCVLAPRSTASIRRLRRPIRCARWCG